MADWIWRIVALAAFAAIMTGVYHAARWLSAATPTWLGIMVIGATIGYIGHEAVDRWEKKRHGRETIFPPD